MPLSHRRPTTRAASWAALAIVPLLLTAGCSSGSDAAHAERPTLRISAIPDQDPSALAAREEALAAYLAEEVDVEVEYVPVSDYAASVTLFKTGDLDLVFYGGLTGVQALQQAPGATLLAQRDVDQAFQSVFIANTSTGIERFDQVAGLSELAGTRFTFGSESSTSGRMMPEFFLAEAGVDTAQDFAAAPGFSGSHDKTVDLVESGTYEAGVLNSQVWEARLEAGTVDLDRVAEVFVSPSYHDYHWIAGAGTDDRFGGGFTEELRDALLGLDGSDSGEVEVLDAYGAESIVPTEAANYTEIEEVARDLGLLS